MVGLPGGMAVEWLKVDRPPERPVFLGADDHPMAPSHGRTQGDFLQYTQADISVQASLYLVLPVDWDWDWCVAGFWCGSRIDAE